MESMIDGRLSRRWLVNELLRNRGDLLVVACPGSTVWDCAAAGDHPLTFPVWAAMGAASTVGLGLALAQSGRQVLVVTGDGEMLMQLGALATIALARPSNVAICVLDNERWGETGDQPKDQRGQAASRNAAAGRLLSQGPFPHRAARRRKSP